MNALQELLSDEFQASIGVVGSPEGLRRCLLKSGFVAAIRDVLWTGQLTEASIERFVAALMKDFQRGIQFPHELPMAAIAVALESRKTKFSEDYLIDLARLKKIAEMDVAPRLAAICLNEWYQSAKVTMVPSANRFPKAWDVAMPKRERTWVKTAQVIRLDYASLQTNATP
jgi:hypothetical protein